MSELVTNKNESVQNIYDKLVSLKKEAFSNLDQALNVDGVANTNENIDSAIILYEKCLVLIDNAIEYFNQNKSKLAQLEGNSTFEFISFIFNLNQFFFLILDANRMNTHLGMMRYQTTERLNALKSKRLSQKPSAAAAAASTASNNDFLDIGDEVLENDDFLIIDDDVLNNHKPDSSSSIKEKNIQNILNNNNDFTKATELLTLNNGAQIFYIANDGTVSTPSFPTTLSVYSFDEDVSSNIKNGKQIVGFIRVGDWVYPLVPNEGPGMKTNFNAYIFPNEDNSNNASFIGITFADPNNREAISFFEDLLANYGSLIYQDKNESSGVKHPVLSPSSVSSRLIPAPSATITKPTDEEKAKEKGKEAEGGDGLEKSKSNESISSSKSDKTADKVANQVINGAQMITKGVASTTEYATKYLQVGGDKLKSSLNPCDQPTKVDPKVQSLVKNVRYGTHVTVRVSSFLLNKLGSLASSTAKRVAPHIKEGSKQLLSSTGIAGSKDNATNYVDNVCTVASSSIHGFGMVYDSLEQAAMTLGKNFTQQTVSVVDHKFGNDAAKVAENGMYSVGNVAQSYNNVKNLKIIRTFAKETAKQTLSHSKENRVGEKDTKPIGFVNKQA